MQALANNEASPTDAPGVPDVRSLRRRFFSNAMWSTGGRIASIGSVLASNVILAKSFSTAEFSAYTIAAAAVAFLAMPAAFGAPRAVLRLIREGRATRRPRLVVDSLRFGIRLVALTSIVLSVLFIIGVRFLDPDEKWQAIRDYSLLAASWFSLSALCITLAHALQGFDDFRSSAIVGGRNGGLLTNILFLVAVATAVLTGRLSIRFALSAQIILNGIAAAWALYVLRRAARRQPVAIEARDDLGGRTDASMARWFFGECWPILIIQLTSLGIQQIDILLVGWLRQEHEIAAYGAVMRLGEILAAAQLLAASIAAPFISELYATRQYQKLERMLRGVASLVAVPTLIVAAVFIIWPEDVLVGVFGPDFALGTTALRIGTIGSTVATLTGLNSLTLIMTGQQRQLLWVSAIASGVYLALAPPMISHWGLGGAATATAIVFGVYNVAVTLLVRRRLGVWTVASVSPAALVFAVRQVLRR